MSWLDLLNMLGPLIGTADPNIILTYTAISPSSNVVSGIVDPNIVLTYSVPTPVGVLEDVSVTFEFPVQYRSYQNFTFDVNVTDITGLNVLSFDFTFTYDVDIVSAVNVNPAGITSGKSLTVNTSTPGEISVAFADASPLSGSGQLVEIELYAKTVTPPNEIGNLSWTSFQFNEGTPSSITTDSTLQIIENPTTTPSISYSAVTPADNNKTFETPIINYVAVSPHPIVAGSGIGFVIPPDPIVHSAVIPSSTIGTLTVTPTVPSMVFEAVTPSSSVSSTVGNANTASLAYVAVTPDAPLIGVAATPIITYEAQTPTEETFGTPRTVKLESFGGYSARLSWFPKVSDNGLSNVGEIGIMKCILRNNEGEITSFSGNVYFFVLKPDRTTIEGPFLATEVSTGHYEYEYTPDENGEYYMRFQDPGNTVIEERRFTVVDSKVEV